MGPGKIAELNLNPNLLNTVCWTKNAEQSVLNNICWTKFAEQKLLNKQSQQSWKLLSSPVSPWQPKRKPSLRQVFRGNILKPAIAANMVPSVSGAHGTDSVDSESSTNENSAMPCNISFTLHNYLLPKQLPHPRAKLHQALKQTYCARPHVG